MLIFRVQRFLWNLKERAGIDFSELRKWRCGEEGRAICGKAGNKDDKGRARGRERLGRERRTTVGRGRGQRSMQVLSGV